MSQLYRLALPEIGCGQINKKKYYIYRIWKNDEVFFSYCYAIVFNQKSESNNFKKIFEDPLAYCIDIRNIKGFTIEENGRSKYVPFSKEWYKEIVTQIRNAVKSGEIVVR